MGRRAPRLLKASASWAVTPLIKMVPPTTATLAAERVTGSATRGCLRKELAWSMSAVESAEWARRLVPPRWLPSGPCYSLRSCQALLIFWNCVGRNWRKGVTSRLLSRKILSVPL